MVLVGGILSSSYVDTTTHWMVTEDGKLQEQVSSPSQLLMLLFLLISSSIITA